MDSAKTGQVMFLHPHQLIPLVTNLHDKSRESMYGKIMYVLCFVVGVIEYVDTGTGALNVI